MIPAFDQRNGIRWVKLPLILSWIYTKHELFTFISIRMFTYFHIYSVPDKQHQAFPPCAWEMKCEWIWWSYFPWEVLAFTHYCLILLLGNNFVSLCTFSLFCHFFHLIWQLSHRWPSACVSHKITETLYHKSPALLNHMHFLCVLFMLMLCLFRVVYKLLASKSESIRVQALKVLGYFLKHLGHKWVKPICILPKEMSTNCNLVYNRFFLI